MAGRYLNQLDVARAELCRAGKFIHPGKEESIRTGQPSMRYGADSIGTSTGLLPEKLPYGGSRVICLVPEKRETKTTLPG